MNDRNISDDDIRYFMDNAVAVLAQRKGTQFVYYSEKGMVAIKDNHEITTAGWADENSFKIMEVARKYGINKRYNG